MFIIYFLCWSTANDHVEDNLCAKLQRMQKFGKLVLEDYKDQISPEDYLICKNAKAKLKKPTWYPLTIDVFVKFLYSVCLCKPSSKKFLCPFSLQILQLCVARIQRQLAKASDDAEVSYNDFTPENKRTCHGVSTTMDGTIKLEIQRIRRKQFEKMLAMANDQLGSTFAKQVSTFFCSYHICSLFHLYFSRLSFIKCYLFRRSILTTAIFSFPT